MMGITNVGGGGSTINGNDAILRVIAPANSTVTISKGTVSKSDTGHENANDSSIYDYYFIIHMSQFDSGNPWTVTATLGSETASDSVIIDSADEYDVVLSYRTFIYNNGTQVVPLTSKKSTNGIVNFEDNYVEITYNTSSSAAANVCTTDLFDVTGFSTLYYKMIVNVSNASYPINIGLANNNSSSLPTFALKMSPTVETDVLKTFSLDVSNMSGSYYVSCAGIGKVKIYEIYLMR